MKLPATDRAMTLTQDERSTLSLLRRAADKAEQDGTALRDTRDVADYLGCSTPHARRVLSRLADQSFVDCYEGTPLLWSVTPSGRAALSLAGDKQ